MQGVYYVLVVISTILFSLQFLFNQRFQETYGTGMKATQVFSLYKSLVIILMMLLIAGFTVEFTWFSLGMATVYALSGIAMGYYSLKAFSVANLSVYSVFSMLVNMFPNRSIIDYKYREQLADLLPATLLAGVMFTVTYLISFCEMSYFIMLPLQILVGVVVYVGLSIVTKNETFSYLLGFIKRNLFHKK